MRILISGQTYYPGNNGQAIFTIQLAEGLARAGNDVAVVVPSDRFAYSKEMMKGVQVHRIHTIPFHFIHQGADFNPMPGLKARSIIRDFQPDVVHVQDHYFINWDTVRIARQMGIPVMGTNHFIPENLLPYFSKLRLPKEFKTYVLWQLMLWTYNLVDVVTTPTETAARILSRQNILPPIYPISCGVDTKRFTPLPGFDRGPVRQKWGLDPDATTFLYVGRLDREKRVDLLLRGLAGLKQEASQTGRQEKVQMAVAGSGAAAGDLSALAKELNLDGKAVFLGYVPASDLPDLYRASDVFCMPSPEELQSIATLEAMASAKPVIAADARALPELVTSQVNGSLFVPGSSISVTASMRWMIDHKAGWEAMGRASRSRALVHSLENTIKRYEELYGRMLEMAPRPVGSARRVKAPVSLK